MNPFEKLHLDNKLLIDFAYYVEQPNGEMQDSLLEQLDTVLADTLMSEDLLLEARNIIERLTEIIKITSDRIELKAKADLKLIPNN